jgi:long-chain fatty acid transport protein
MPTLKGLWGWTRLYRVVPEKVMYKSAARAGIAVVLGMLVAESASAQGAVLSAAGPVHRSMGGASTAAPVSALGALYWNPATISGLSKGELEVGLDLLTIDHRVESSFGPFSGATDAEAGTLPLPNFAWVHPIAGTPLTFGLSANSVAGFKTSLPADLSNPVLMPQPIGLGGVNSEASFMQVSPVLSFAATDRVSIAAGPTITLGQVGVDPFVFDSINGDGTYPSGRASHYHWGGGLQAGVFYLGENGWNLGASIKSPTWMEGFEFQGRDENGLPRTMTADIDLPLIFSVGTALTSIEDWLFAVDVRYLDYANTDGFGDSATFGADGSLRGLDWSSVFATAVGVERRLGERFVVRGGYSYNQSPIRDSDSFYNVAAPLIYEHILSCGGSYHFCQNVSFNVGYSHYFENTRQGAIVSPIIGPVPGSSVTNRVSADLISFGIQMRH